MMATWLFFNWGGEREEEDKAQVGKYIAVGSASETTVAKAQLPAPGSVSRESSINTTQSYTLPSNLFHICFKVHSTLDRGQWAAP
jgi:hypothetical protein